MRRSLSILVAVVATFAIAGAAMAANPHFVSGPTFSFDGNTATATGSVAGLGNQNIDVELTVEASLTVQCRNPGGNIAPGQTKFFQATDRLSNLEVKNGRVNFTIEVNLAGVDLAGSCPNARWTPLPGALTIHSATLTIYQPAGSGIAVLTHSF